MIAGGLCSIRSGTVRTGGGVPERRVRNPGYAGEGSWEGVERRHLETLGKGGLGTGRPRVVSGPWGGLSDQGNGRSWGWGRRA